MKMNRLLAVLVAPLLLLHACAQKPPEPDARELTRETAGFRDPDPAPELLAAVQRFKAADPDASFGYFNGHVDSFATTPKPAVPAYAVPVLERLGLMAEASSQMWFPSPRSPTDRPHSAHDLDGDSSVPVPILRELEVAEEVSDGRADPPEEPGTKKPSETIGEGSASDAQRMIEWNRPEERTLALERRAAVPVLGAFLVQYADVFEPAARAVDEILVPVDYQAFAFGRRAVFEQQYSQDERLLYGRTVVQFDANWNVVGISRMITSEDKLQVPALADGSVSRAAAVEVAAGAFAECRGREHETLRAERAVDPVRRQRVWDVELLSPDGDCHWRTVVDAKSGDVLNVSDLIDRYTDARVNRWYFPGGDLFDPRQIVSTGTYTRNDRRLEHDFFYVMNDHRCEGDPETSCSATPQTDTWCEDAHGTTNGDSFIRATRRTSRDFDQYYPGGSSEAFAETNAYYWARSFSQWLKPSLDAMGVLPGSASDYPRVLIITDACRTGSVHNSSYAVTTEDDKGEGTNVIRLAHRNPSGTSNHNAACQGGGCFDNPSNLQHELNHFFLKRYYGVGSDLDCGSANQLKFTHEGILGTAVPQAYWHSYYGVGYNPSTDHLYFSNGNVGRVHSSDSNRMTISDFLCVNFTDDAYRAGRVVGQALWEFFHGKRVTGSSIGNTWSPSTDTDFNTLVYWAADLQAASTYKDRYEFANRVMEILDKHSNWTSAAKRDYCDIFRHHELDNFIDSDYCA